LTALLLLLALAFPQEKPGVPEKGKVQEPVGVAAVGLVKWAGPESE
jgi:hypothetical protein